MTNTPDESTQGEIDRLIRSVQNASFVLLPLSCFAISSQETGQTQPSPKQKESYMTTSVRSVARIDTSSNLRFHSSFGIEDR